MPNTPTSPSGQPPSAGFSQRLERLRTDLTEQGKRVQAMVDLALEAIFNRDDAKAKLSIAMDDAVDTADVELEKACVQLLADATREGASLDQGQLRLVLTIAKANNELERIADAAVDVGEMVPAIRQASQSFPDTFRVMANSVIGILRDTNTSVAKNDPLLAKVVLQSQHAVTAFKAAIMRDTEERIAKGAMGVDFAFRLHEIASQCELIADHCTNIAEQIIYLTTGSIVRHTDARWIEVPQKS